DERRIDFFDEAPDPVEPEGLESIDRRSADEQLVTAERAAEGIDNPARHLLVDPAVMLEAHPRVFPGAVRLAPYRPVPSANRLLTPALDALPHDLAAAIRKPPAVMRAVE